MRSSAGLMPNCRALIIRRLPEYADPLAAFRHVGDMHGKICGLEKPVPSALKVLAYMEFTLVSHMIAGSGCRDGRVAE